jgi:hypothetical protein
MMEALWITRVGMLSARARRMMSVWVVALRVRLIVLVVLGVTEVCSPEGIAHDEQRYVLLMCVVEDFVTLCFDHVTIGEDEGFTVEYFLG